MTKAFRAAALALALCLPARSADGDCRRHTAKHDRVPRSGRGGERSAPVYGVSVMHFPAGLFGVDAEIAIGPSFFTDYQLVDSSRVVTAHVSVVIAIPVV